MAPSGKCVVVGWDGATFDVLQPLVRDGALPHLAALLERGAWGRLETTVPPLTPVAWTSISTGVNPGKHGIFDAIAYSREERAVHFLNASYRRVRPVWSLLSERGRSAGVVNVPLTYPADEIDGFVIPGMYTPPGVPDFCHPPALRDELIRTHGKYEIECRQSDDPGAYLDRILEMAAAREKTALYLMDRHPTDFFFVTFVASDRVQHFFWKFLDPEHPQHDRFADAIGRVYRRMDEALGAIVEKAGPDAHVVMVSDHGAGPIDHAFFLNNWLLKNGYLALTEDPVAAFRKRKSSRLLSLARRVVRKLLPSGAAEGQAAADLNLFLSMVDWEKTTAFSEGVGGGVYINESAVGPDRYDEVADRLSRDLEAVRGPDGRQVLSAVRRRREVYSGDATDGAADLIVTCAPRYHLISPNEFRYFNDDYRDELFMPHRWSARHETHGILVLGGPGVSGGLQLSECSVLDVAPTILHLMGGAVPGYMDGRVLEDAFDRGGELRRDVSRSDEAESVAGAGAPLSADEEREVAARLKDLGYME